MVEEHLGDLEARSAKLRALPRQLIHADVSAQNLLLGREGHVAGLLDFGDVVVSARVADIAVAIASLGFAAGRIRPALCQTLWEGWCEVIAPSVAERAALVPLLRSRFVKLVVDHVWREQHAGHHPGHQRLIDAGIDGLLALSGIDLQPAERRVA
jgi:Ser/Thr protein kinase RdoA (MazF antagonist)